MERRELAGCCKGTPAEPLGKDAMKVLIGLANEVTAVDVDSLTESQARQVCAVIRECGLVILDSVPVSSMVLSVRAENGLKREKITTVGGLLRRLDDKRAWPGVGKTSIQEYRRELSPRVKG